MLLLVSLALPILLLGWGLSESDDDEDTATEEIEGTEGDDMIEGSQRGDDILQGEDGNDMLCAGDGDDILTGNTGADFLEGQAGDDFVSGDYNGDIVHGDEGNDTVIGGRGGDRVAGNSGDDVVFGGIVNRLPMDLEEMQELRGGASLADILEGEGGMINIRDDSFADMLFGGGGADQLFIGGLDNATGGNGEDTFNLLQDQRAMGPATINDFNADDDNVTVIVNGDDDIDLSIEIDGDDALLMADGAMLARVTGAAGTLTALDITILSESSVVGLFDPNA